MIMGGRMADSSVESRITREEAVKLAELAEGSYFGGDEGFALLDEMFPEWAPFKHALCHPCKEEGCGEPTRYGDYCDKHWRPKQHISLIHPSIKAAYYDLLYGPNPLLKYLDNPRNRHRRTIWDGENK